MINHLRMDLYRLLRTKSFYVCLAILSALCIFATFSIWYTSTPEFREGVSTLAEEVQSEQALQVTSEESEANIMEEQMELAESLSPDSIVPTFPQYMGSVFVSSGILTLLIALFFVLFVGIELDSGFIKNIFTTRRGRGVYYASKTILAVILSIVFILVGALVCAVGLLITGIEFTFSLPDLMIWLLAAVLTCSAYAMIALFFVMLTKNKTAGIIASCLIASSILGMILASIMGMFPDFAQVLDYTVFAGFSSLGQGFTDPTALSATHISVVAGAYFAAFCALGFVCIRKRDI